MPFDVAVQYAVSSYTGLITLWLESRMPYTHEEIARDGESNRRIYCDTAKVADSGTLGTIDRYFGSDRILFGSDFPWANSKKAKYWIGKIKNHSGTEATILSKILHSNADVILSAKTQEVYK